MFKALASMAATAWHDEMTMLWLAIWVLTPTAVLVMLNFGLFFVAMNHYAEFIIAVATIGFVCMGRAAMLRLSKVI